jgi:glycosyltransferase involved in cell wall biosynthesis
MHALRRMVPDVLNLVFRKQYDSVLCSRGLIVPSAPMKELLCQEYPALPAERVHVIPWGWIEETVDSEVTEKAAAALRDTHNIPPAAPVLLTLSRISPEKGQDRLLEALRLWEQAPDFPTDGLWLFIAGEAAYMQGKRFEKKLRARAARLRRTRVHFSGYAAGERKAALFRLADLYVFPSSHESYGLTSLEAMGAGLPVLACASHGASDVVEEAWGERVPNEPTGSVPQYLLASLRRMLRDREGLRRMGEQARVAARQRPFTQAADRLAALLVGRPLPHQAVSAR